MVNKDLLHQCIKLSPFQGEKLKGFFDNYCKVCNDTVVHIDNIKLIIDFVTLTEGSTLNDD